MSIRTRIRQDRPLVVELTLAAVHLAGVALVAVGVSGLVAWIMGASGGRAFVAGDAPGVTYTAARCRDLFEYTSHAGSCTQAAAAHHFVEVVAYRIAAGLLGLGVLLVSAVLRRRAAPAVLPPTFVPTVAAVAFGIVGALLVGQGVDLLVLSVDAGGGQYLSGGVVALALAAWYSRPVLRALERGLPVDPAPA